MMYERNSNVIRRIFGGRCVAHGLATRCSRVRRILLFVTSKLGCYCDRWDSNPQDLGVTGFQTRSGYQFRHGRAEWVSSGAGCGRSRLPLGATAIPHSTTESGAGVAPAISTLAKDAAYYSPTRTHPTP